MEIQCHKGFYLKHKAAINNTKISSLICGTILIFNEHNFQYLLVVSSPTMKFFGESFFANDLMGTLITLHGKENMTNAETVPSWFLLNLKVVQVT